MTMTLDEYISDRDDIADKERQRRVFLHVSYRLRDRFGINREHWNKYEWVTTSHACVTRQLEVIRRDNQAVFCVSTFCGERVVWVYSRVLKMIVTVLRADEVENRFKYMEAIRHTR
jgi:hypothetical protein